MTDKNVIVLPTGRKVALPDEFQEIAGLCRAEEVVIGGRTVLGMADARDLHAGLGVGRYYTNWIKGRIKKYGFREGVDFEVVDTPNRANQGHGGDRRSIIYRLTLDTAKELAMVENNERGRLIRRYYIWLEEMAHGASDELTRRIDGVSRSTIHKVTSIERAVEGIGTVLRLMSESATEQDRRTELLETAALESARQIKHLTQVVEDMVVTNDRRRAAVDYVLPIEIVERYGVPQKGRRVLTTKIGNRLAKRCAQHGRPVKLSAETGKRMFPTEIVDEWLVQEGRAMLADCIAQAAGQGVLKFPNPRRK